MSTHSHKQTVAADVKDGSATIFHATDWEHPGSQQWPASPFYKFGAASMTWACTYDNTGSNAATTVVAGQSAQTNEMCIFNGQFYPIQGTQNVLPCY